MKGEVALHVSWFGKLFFFFPDFTSFHKKIDKLIHISMKTPYTNKFRYQLIAGTARYDWNE